MTEDNQIELRARIEKLEAALEWAGTMIKMHVKPQRCVSRDDEIKSAIDVYGEIQKALEDK